MPADIYSSSIVIEVSGVRVKTKLQEDHPLSKPQAHPRKQTSGRANQQGRSEFSEDAKNDQGDNLPTPHDLAKSFLDQEPAEGKAELEAELASRSTDLQQSALSSEAGEDEPGYGNGVKFTLPAFLTGFLKDITKRLQLKVSDVLYNLESEVEVPPEERWAPSVEAGPNTFVLDVRIDRIDVEREVPPSPGHPHEPCDPDGERRELRELSDLYGSRRIILKGVRSSLHIACTNSTEDSSGNEEHLKAHVELSPVHSWSPVEDRSHESNLEGRPDEPAKTQQCSAPSASKLSSTRKRAGSSILSNPENVAGAESDVEMSDTQFLSQDEMRGYSARQTRPALSGVRATNPDSSQDYVPSMSSQKHDLLQPTRPEKRSRAAALAPSAHSRSRIPPYPGYQRRPRSISPPARIPGGFGTDDAREGGRYPMLEPHHLDITAMSHEQSPAVTPSADPQLSESTLFTHEDAESIYMSVIDESPTNGHQPQQMPGGWTGNSLSSSNPPNLDFGLATAQSKPTSLSSVSADLWKSHVEPSNAPDFADYAKSAHDCHAQCRPPNSNSPEVSPTTDNLQEEDRQVFALDKVELTFRTFAMTDNRGCAENPEHEPGASLSMSWSDRRSLYREIPGTFSQYAEAVASEKRAADFTANPSDPSEPQENGLRESRTPSESRNLIYVLIGNIESQLRLSTLKPLVKLITKLTSQFHHAGSLPQHQVQAGQPKESFAPRYLRVNLTSLSIGMLEEPESTRTSRTEGIPRVLGQPKEETTSRALFNVMLSKAQLHLHHTSSGYESHLRVDRLLLSLAGRDAIWFDRNAQMTASVRNDRSSSNGDVYASVKAKSGSLDVTVLTFPINIDLNFYRLDEALSSFGGFSGLLELGSSVLSDTGLVARASPETLHRPRAVRFESSAKVLRESIEPPPPKSRLNVRIEGSRIDLKGRDKGVKLQSSAIKLVNRDAGVGIQVDQAKLQGPTMENLITNQTIDVKLHSMSLRYHFAPEEGDLTRLISLLTPSSDKFEEDDDYLVDTLVRQRKNGAVVRFKVSKADVSAPDMDALHMLGDFVSEIGKLSSVTKYIPQESRPGVMVLGVLNETCITMKNAPKVDHLVLHLKICEIAHVSVPSLIAMTIEDFTLQRNSTEELIHPVVSEAGLAHYPMLMARMIGEEMEPTMKIKLWNVCLEYNVPLMVALLNSSHSKDQEDVRINLATSIANLKGQAGISRVDSQSSSDSAKSGLDFKTLMMDITFRDCALGLTPRNLPSKCLFVLTNARINGKMPRDEDMDMNMEIRKAAMLLTNDVAFLESSKQTSRPVQMKHHTSVESHQISELCHQGFVTVSWISAASAQVSSTAQSKDEPHALEILIQDELFVLETCADSTQTLTELFGALSPPAAPTQGVRYRTEIAPVEDMMASFTGDAFAIVPEKSYTPIDERKEDEGESDFGTGFDDLGAIDDLEDAHSCGEEEQQEDEEENLYGPENLFDSIARSEAPDSEIAQAPAPDGAPSGEQSEIISGALQPTTLPPRIEGIASRWNSTTNRYVPVTKSELNQTPLRINVKDLHIIWNLHDGYDWQKTRDTLSKAVDEVEAKAEERRNRRRLSRDEEEDEESVISDFLFNSIYIGIPVNHDPRELSGNITKDVDDLATETESQTTVTTARPLTKQHTGRPHKRKLKLERSKRHKLTMELRGASADFFVYPSGGETSSSTNINIKHLEIFDHVPTSTWKKFATYMQDAGPREEKKPMVHLEICEVRPVPELTATELVIRVSPLEISVQTY